MHDRPRPRRDDAPPPTEGFALIRRITHVTKRSYLILSSRLHGFWGHWTGSSTVACTGDTAEICEGHRREWPTKWRGYLHVISNVDGQDCIIELPPGAAEQLLLQVSADQSLRGFVLEAWRTSSSTQAHYRLQLHPRTRELESLPSERDPAPHVARLWSCAPKALRSAERNGKKQGGEQ